MRYFLIGFLALVLALPAVAASTTGPSASTKGATKYALFSGKHRVKKAKKAPKHKKARKGAKRHPRAKSSR